jgi:hypothetical protein
MKPESSGPKVVDVAFAALAILCLCAIPTISPLFGKLMLASWAAVCVAGIVFRWGWLVPSTMGTFLLLQMFQPFLRGYSHSQYESLQHDLIFPTVFAVFVAALQLGCSWVSENSDLDEPSGGGKVGERPAGEPHGE